MAHSCSYNRINVVFLLRPHLSFRKKQTNTDTRNQWVLFLDDTFSVIVFFGFDILFGGGIGGSNAGW